MGKENISEGRFMEEAVLGKTIAAYQREIMKEWETKEEHIDYPFPTMIELVKHYQPSEDPTEIKKPLPKALLAEISARLNLGDRQLRYYTSVSSHLDWHGMDCFMEMDMGNGDNVITFLDISSNPKKISPGAVEDRGHKIVFHWPREGLQRKDDPQIWQDKIFQLASVIEKRFRLNAMRAGFSEIPNLTEFEVDESKKLAIPERKKIIMQWDRSRKGL